MTRSLKVTLAVIAMAILIALAAYATTEFNTTVKKDDSSYDYGCMDSFHRNEELSKEKLLVNL